MKTKKETLEEMEKLMNKDRTVYGLSNMDLLMAIAIGIRYLVEKEK